MENKKIVVTSTSLAILCTIYYTTKILWDTIIPYLFEIVFILILTFIAFKQISSSLILNMKNDRMLVFFYSIFSIYIVIRLASGDNIEYIKKALYEYCFFSLLFFSLIFILDRVDYNQLFKALSIVGLIIVILTWIEYYKKSYFIPRNFSGASIVSGNLDGAYGFRASLFTRSYLSHGVVIGFYCLVLFSYYLITRKKIWFWGSILALLTINTTGSRGSLVATGVALCLYIVMYNNLSKTITIKKMFVYLLLFIIGMGIWLILTSNVKTGVPMIDQFLFRFRGIIDWSGEAGNRGRLIIWDHYIKMFIEHKTWGVGPSKTGSYNALYGATESGVLKRLVETGWVGFFLYYIIEVYTLCYSHKRKNAIKKNKEYEKSVIEISSIFSIAVFIEIFIDDITLQATEELMVVYLLWFGLAGYYTNKGRIKCDQ